MKYLKLKKVKIAKIDHINKIIGGQTDGYTTGDECITTELKSKDFVNDQTIIVRKCDPYTTTDRRTMAGNTTDGFEESRSGC